MSGEKLTGAARQGILFRNQPDNEIKRGEAILDDAVPDLIRDPVFQQIT